MTDIAAERQAVVTEALEWLGTPYMSNGQVKGRNGGVDCLTFLAGVYGNTGMIPPLPIPHYPHDWHLHHSDEHYLMGKDSTPGVMHFCTEQPPDTERKPEPGDVIMYKFGLCFSHAAIVIEWPIIIHAWWQRAVGRDDAIRRTVLNRVHEIIALRGQPRPRKVFTINRWIQ